jgi:hypothetical protein
VRMSGPVQTIAVQGRLGCWIRGQHRAMNRRHLWRGVGPPFGRLLSGLASCSLVMELGSMTYPSLINAGLSNMALNVSKFGFRPYGRRQGGRPRQMAWLAEAEDLADGDGGGRVEHLFSWRRGGQASGRGNGRRVQEVVEIHRVVGAGESVEMGEARGALLVVGGFPELLRNAAQSRRGGRRVGGLPRSVRSVAFGEQEENWVGETRRQSTCKVERGKTDD